jgi:hypothetical protein
MDLNRIDVRVLLNDHVDVWHPNKNIRVEARARLRKTLTGLHVIDIEKLVEWMKIPCLLRMQDKCMEYLKNVGENVGPDNIDDVLYHSRETVEYIEWINDQLGVEEAVRQPDYGMLRRKAVEKLEAGTLLAYC